MNQFKAYDIRGIYPYEVDEDFAYHLGTILHKVLETDTVVVGHDGRNSSNDLYDSLTKGLLESGKNIISIGECSTPQFYFTSFTRGIAGVMITASHNPKEYNGFKICGPNARPIFIENGLKTLEHDIKEPIKIADHKGSLRETNIQNEYNTFFSRKKVKLYKPFKVIIDTGNGMGHYEVQALKEALPDLNIQTIFEDIDGDFPNHECNPIREDQYDELKKQLQTNSYDFGIAFDGDADRVGFYTKEGLVPADIITALVGSFIAKEHDKVAYEVRSSQVVKEVLEEKKITPILYRSGHAYMKEAMRKDGVFFAGEKSGHYFFQQLHNTDSPLLTIINIFKILNQEKISLEELARPLIQAYANSGEVNYTVKNPDKAIEQIEVEFKEEALNILKIDGISVFKDHMFFNVRKSNTEPLVRVNIEAKTKDEVEKVKKHIEKVLSRY